VFDYSLTLILSLAQGLGHLIEI